MTKRKRKRLTWKNFGAGVAMISSTLGVLSQLGVPIAAPVHYLIAQVAAPPITYAELQKLRSNTSWPTPKTPMP